MSHTASGEPRSFDAPRIEAAVAEILAAIGEDPARPGLIDTPHRVAEAYREFFGGLTEDPVAHLAGSTEFGGEATGDLVIVRDIDFRSICEHHLLPFIGSASVAYLPGERIVGLGAIAKVVGTLSARPQLQERLTDEIADALQSGLEPRGILVVMTAAHGCVTARGTRQPRSSTVTVATRGMLAEPQYRGEALALIGAGPADRSTA